MNTTSPNTTSPRKIEALQISRLNWPRIMSAIGRSSHTYPEVDRVNLGLVESQLRQLIEIMGFWSISRKALTNIGEALFHAAPEGVKIISPVCFDHDQVMRQETITFPKLVSAHIEFIEKIRTVISVRSATFLFASYGKTLHPEIKRRMNESAVFVQQNLTDPFYSAMPMGSYLPNIRAEEQRIKYEISNTPDFFHQLIRILEHERRKGSGIGGGTEGRLITRRNSTSIAEFYALGRHASANGILICYHTTGRSRCFQRAGAGVLHNPVGFR